jgi:hypothetical protein
VGKGIPCKSYTKGKSRRAIIQASQLNQDVPQGPTNVPNVRKSYLENTDPSIGPFVDDCIIYRKGKPGEGFRRLGRVGGRLWNENKSL